MNTKICGLEDFGDGRYGCAICNKSFDGYPSKCLKGLSFPWPEKSVEELINDDKSKDATAKREGAEIFVQKLEEFVDALIESYLNENSKSSIGELRLATNLRLLNELQTARREFVEACITISV